MNVCSSKIFFKKIVYLIILMALGNVIPNMKTTFSAENGLFFLWSLCFKNVKVKVVNGDCNQVACTSSLIHLNLIVLRAL